LQIDKTVFSGRQSSTEHLVNTFNGNFNTLNNRIPLVVQTGSSTGYNTSTNEYIIQESGNYRVYGGARMIGTHPAPGYGTSGILYLFPWGVLQQYNNIHAGVAPVLSTFWEGYLGVGTPVSIDVVSWPGSVPENIRVSLGFLTIVKLAY
jgi:hypothetical protein